MSRSNNTSRDANGNIEAAERHDENGQQYDDFAYQYHTAGGQLLQNRLYDLYDGATHTTGADIVAPAGTFDNSTTVVNQNNNYSYDELGNLIADKREEIGSIHWTVAGKVKRIARTPGSTKPELVFAYGADGQRIMKQVGEPTQGGYKEYYIREAQGNIMATYRYTISSSAGASLKLTERPIYGSSRIGSHTQEMEMIGSTPPQYYPYTQPMPAPKKRFELTDHLGNVSTVVTGKLMPMSGGGYQADVVSAQSYEPFGSLLPGRNYSSDSYRFGFQGQEKDDEVYGATGTSYAFEYRMHDPRIGRFLSIDPLAAEYPYNSPYAFAENKVIQFVELEGLECGQGASTAPQKPTDDPGAALVDAGKRVWDFFTSDDVPAQEKLNAVLPDKLGMLALKGISQLPQGKRMGLEVDLSGWGVSEWTEAAQEGIGLGAGLAAGTSAKAANAGWRAPMKAPTKLPKPAPVQTPHGPAVQAMTPEAMAARGPVGNGALLYRQGSFGVQNTADAQFWSLTGPGATPNYVQSLGMPGASNQGANWIMTGQLRAGTPFVVRPAPGIGTNAGGALEVVTPPGGVQVQSFTMP